MTKPNKPEKIKKCRVCDKWDGYANRKEDQNAHKYMCYEHKIMMTAEGECSIAKFETMQNKADAPKEEGK
jgi:hypothetical protein